MHNRAGAAVTSFDMSVRDGLVIVPLVMAVVAFALYPQQALHHSEPAVKASVAPMRQAATASQHAQVTP
jgi:NADH-quinone oxidoreductase subunit M